MSSMVIVAGAVLIAFTFNDHPSPISNLSIQDITSSSSSAVHILNGIHHETTPTHDHIIEVVVDHGQEQIVAQEAQLVAAQPEPIEEQIVAQEAQVVAAQPEPIEVEVAVIQESQVDPETLAAQNQDHEQPQQQQQQQQEHVVDIIEWMIQGGAVFPNIEIVEYTGHDEYRGIHATADLSADHVLAEIPDQFIITFDKARDSEIGQRIIKALPEYNDISMSHCMIALFLVVELDKAESSWWWPYLRTLPTHFRNMPPNYTPEEIEFGLESQLESIFGDRFQTDYEEICEAIPDFCQQHSFETYKRGRLILRSRAFSLDRNGDGETALQPFVDMINHDIEKVAASWRYDQDGQRGEIYAKRAIKAGDVVTLSYGSKSNRVLLRTYGFAIPNNPNHEAILFLQLPDGETASGMLARRVAKTGNPSTEFYRIQHSITLSTSDDDFKDAMKLCRVSVATSDELDQHEAFDQPISLENEARALRYMQESIDFALYKHTTTVDEDEKLLQSSTLSENERNIILTRYSDKLTLIMMNEILEDLLDLADHSVDQRTFSKRRYHHKYSGHLKYVRSLVELRRLAR